MEHAMKSVALLVSVFGLLLMPSFFNVVWRHFVRPYNSATIMATAAASQTPTPYSMAFVTVPNEEVAKKIANGLVQNKLAACVNIIPKVVSVYEWEGKINEDSELLLMIKTRTSVMTNLTSFVKDNHPYDVCEVISTSIEHGNQPYLDWIGTTVPAK